VGEKQDTLRACAAESCNNRAAGTARRVLEPRHVGRRVDELDLAAERPKAPGDELGDATQTVDVSAARLD